jgi:glutathione S-transferase
MSKTSASQFELYYWPGLQGRGEFIRLALEEAAAPYVDVVRLPKAKGGGIEALQRVLRGEDGSLRPFAPPILKVDGLVLAQVANILQFLGPRLGLAPESEAGRFALNQLQLTITDLVAEAHDTHHPISNALYYEDQKTEAKRRTEDFLAQRAPKFLGYFEDVLKRNGGQFLVGEQLTYVDLSIFQVLSGLAYAFPRAFEGHSASIPGLLALRDRVAARPNIAAYLASERRVPFNETGIFRRYPELDEAPKKTAR